MTTISLLLLNETLTTNDSEINGISYSIKKGSVLIKLWCKNFKNECFYIVSKNNNIFMAVNC